MTYLGRDLILPSAQSAADLIDGEKGLLLGVVGCTLFRAGIVAAGLYGAGFRGQALSKASIAGSLAVETFVVGYAIYDKGKIL